MPNRRSLFRHLFAAAACAGALVLGGMAAAHAATSKISADLAQAASANTLPTVGWAKTLGGQRYVKVLIVASGSDPRLSALRSTILANDGSVYVVFDAVRAMSAMVPVSLLPTLAARGDVVAIAPNRGTTRSGSLVADRRRCPATAAPRPSMAAVWALRCSTPASTGTTAT